MGYCYDSRTGALVCDGCGISGGVRKRTCTAKVLWNSLRGPRSATPYCYPPALCATCYQKVGGAAMHAKCKIAAAEDQAEHDEIERQLDAGELFVVAAHGAGSNPYVPKGQAGVIFQGRGERREWRLVDVDEYHAAQKARRNNRLSDFPGAQPWAPGQAAPSHPYEVVTEAGTTQVSAPDVTSALKAAGVYPDRYLSVRRTDAPTGGAALFGTVTADGSVRL
jgi:hypothetical protein